MRHVGVLLTAIVLGACASDPVPTPTPALPEEAPRDLIAWAEGAKHMVWQHTAQRAPPELELARVEMCEDFAIVFFAAPHDGRVDIGDDRAIDADFLWAAGLLSEAPEGADGGWTAEPERDTEPYRAEHGPCVIAFDRR